VYDENGYCRQHLSQRSRRLLSGKFLNHSFELRSKRKGRRTSPYHVEAQAVEPMEGIQGINDAIIVRIEICEVGLHTPSQSRVPFNVTPSTNT
jgi:hypothetical protein